MPLSKPLMPPTKADIEILAEKLAQRARMLKEAEGRPGRYAEPAAALAESVGCSWSTAKSWLEGSAYPKRRTYLVKLEELLDEQSPQFDLELSEPESHVLKFCCAQLEQTGGEAGQWASYRIKKELNEIDSFDVGRIARFLAMEKRKQGLRMGPAAALAEAVGCSWNTAQSWIKRDAMPKRGKFVEKIEQIGYSMGRRMMLPLTRLMATMLMAVCGDLRILFGSTGDELADRIEKKVLEVYPDMASQSVK